MKMRELIIIVAGFVLCLGLGAAQAEQIFYESFEDPVINGTVDTTPTGWTSTRTDKTGLSDAAVAGKTGDQFAHIDDYPNNNLHDGALTTTTSIFNTNLVPYVHYTLTCDLTGGTTGYEGTMELLAGGTVLSNDVETVSTANDFTAKKLQIDYMAYPGNTKLGSKLAVRLSNTAGSWEQKVYFDNLRVQAIDTSVDVTAPTPNPMTWVQKPTPCGNNGVLMTCSKASDTNWVQYFFTNTVNKNNSGWIDVTTWRDTGLLNGITYSYKVKARDRSTNHNETAWSSEESATVNKYVLFYDSFEHPIVSGAESLTDPVDWVDMSSGANLRCGLGYLKGTAWTNTAGAQAAWLNVYATTPILETTLSNLNTFLKADKEPYVLTFNAADNGSYTLCADLLAGTNVVLTAQKTPTSQNFAQNVASNSFSPKGGDPGVGEALKLRLRVTGGQWNEQSYVDNLRLTGPPLPGPAATVMIIK